jgi:hypothetical protein
MSKSRSIKGPDDLVVTRKQLNAAFRAHGQKIEAAITQSFKVLEDRQDAFEEKIMLALLAIEDARPGSEGAGIGIDNTALPQSGDATAPDAHSAPHEIEL